MAQIAISGRLGNEPKSHTAKNDKPMAAGFMFGEVDSQDDKQWIAMSSCITIIVRPKN